MEVEETEEPNSALASDVGGRCGQSSVQGAAGGVNLDPDLVNFSAEDMKLFEENDFNY